VGKNLHIVTFGCQMNVHDSDRMAAILKAVGYNYTDDVTNADLILINTCSVREGPEHKVHSQAGIYKPLKDKNPDLIIGICGCVAQQKGEDILKQISYVDLVFGTDALPILDKLVLKAEQTKERICATTFQDDESYKFVEILPDYSKNKFSDFVTISKGCNKRCSYCIVPFTRGKEIAKPYQLIIKEIEKMVSFGIKEVTLLGQTVNSYKDVKNDVDFSKLLKLVSDIEGIERIRFTSPHPKYFTKELMDTMAELPKVMSHIHYPLQSGSNSILKHMRRQYSTEQYIEQVDYLRKIIPNMEITTDIIVGYPTETKEDFNDTLNVMKRVEFENSFSFLYSPRPFTTVFETENITPEEENKERLQILKELQETISKNKTQKLIGSVQEVLIEEENDGRNKNQYSGRSRGNRKVYIDDIKGYKLGDIVNVKIISGSVMALKGEII